MVSAGLLTGLLTAVHKDHFRVIGHRELLFNRFGDRVAQLLHVELVLPLSQCRNNNVLHEILIVNTHLLFPHDSSLCLERLRQVGYFVGILKMSPHCYLYIYIFYFFSIVDLYLNCVSIGLQNLGICRSLSERKQPKSFAYHTLRVKLYD